jgi:hypothetical protein
MAPAKLQTNPRKWLPSRWAHLRDRIKDRGLNDQHAELIKGFFDGQPWVPDLEEAPAGWHKYLDKQGLLICGEGEQWKTLYTPSIPGRPRPESVDLDEWEARGRKPPESPPVTPSPETSATAPPAQGVGDLPKD